MPLWRSQLQNVYSICARCGTRMPLSKLRWQNGILVCDFYNCTDTAIIGKRDLDVARAVQVDRHEMEVDRKLTEPIDRKDDLDDILY